MGRYAQRRRAATTVSPWVPPPPTGVSIVSISPTFLGGEAAVTFDQVVNFTTGGPPDGALTINGLTVQFLSLSPSSPGTTCNVNVSGTITVGDAWSLGSQPGWLTEAAGVPQSGLVT